MSSVPMRCTIRPMREADLAAVLGVQAECYPEAMQEPGAVVLARLRAAPATCVVACEAGGAPCAYLFAYPSVLGAVTDLGAAFAPAPRPDTLYVHDLAVAPRALGQGLARALAGHLLALGRAQGLAWSALVSVQDSARFWEGLGYRAATPADCAPGRGLASYPADAFYMQRPLA
ncbi:GNAT family N-acetyltransferase [Massilia sp. DD77]|uniref:GNAT family N-acetyltransferase n=1 Tax=Massilia sp. DD77 TaxID=3109349 RepID=UPI00300002CF